MSSRLVTTQVLSTATTNRRLERDAETKSGGAAGGVFVTEPADIRES